MTRDIGKKLPPIRRAQKKAIGGLQAAGSLARRGMNRAKEGLEAIDREFRVTENAQKIGKRAQTNALAVDEKFNVAERAGRALNSARSAGESIQRQARVASDKSGLTKLIQEAVVEPAGRTSTLLIESTLVVNGVASAARAYGATREIIKPYFLPADAYTLLESTRNQLAYVPACIMQISPVASNQLASQFARAIAAKMAGAGTTAALLGAASFGSASTGAAISGLYGAAATKASLAWVGGLIGGGMVAGAALTGGASIIAGLAAYRALASDRRPVESLTDLERRIVESCWVLMSVCDAHRSPAATKFTPDDARILLEGSLRAFYGELVANADVLCAPLDLRNSVAFRQHVLIDFRRVVIEGFEAFIEDPPSFAGGISADALIGGVFYALMTRHALDASIESHLVLDALRRSKVSLAHADENALGDYLRSLPEGSLRPAAENVKGIYHELLWVNHYNATHTGTYAELFPDTNRPGVDVVVKDTLTHETQFELQLKAVATTTHVTEHLARYPDDPIAVTDEVADRMAARGVLHSGFSDEDLSSVTHDDLAAMQAHTVVSRTENATLVALGIASSAELLLMLQGRRAFPDAVLRAATKAGTTAGATAVTAFLFT